MLERGNVFLIDVRRHEHDNKIEFAYCKYGVGDESIASMLLMNVSKIEQLKDIVQVLEIGQNLFVSNNMPQEFQDLFSAPVMDMKQYGCPSMNRLREMYIEHDGDYVCGNHEKNNCALYNISLLFIWLHHDTTIMRMVCSSINKLNNHGLASLNNLEWRYVPSSLLLLFLSNDLPRVWNILPEQFKKLYPGYEYCQEHYVNRLGGRTMVDGPPQMKKDCLPCRRRRGVCAGMEEEEDVCGCT